MPSAPSAPTPTSLRSPPAAGRGARPAGRASSRRKGELTRERILDAAEALFAERGYEGTTLRDVATRVGLRNPSLYNHFDSKEALYAAVLERGIGPVLALLRELVRGGGDASAAAAEIIAGAMRVLTQRPALARLVQHETLSGGQRLTPMLHGYIVPLFAHGHEMAEDRAQAAGWAREDVPLLVLAIYNVVLGFFAAAPLYQHLNGTDLLAEPVRARQTRLLVEIAERLFTPPARSPAE